MNAFDIVLPKSESDLATFYIIVNQRLNNIWHEYTTYVETSAITPKTALIFPIIFSELDFYEVLLQRIRVKLPDEVLREIDNEFFFPDW